MAAKYKTLNKHVKDNEDVPNDPSSYYHYQMAEYKHLQFYVRFKIRKRDSAILSKAFSFELNPKRWEYVWNDFIEDEFKFS